MSDQSREFVRLKKFPKFATYKLTTRREIREKKSQPPKQFDLAASFQNMMQVTQEVDRENKRRAEEAIANAFQKMIDLSAKIEKQNQQIQEAARREYEERTRVCNNKVANRILKKAPAKYRRLPKVFKKNPKLVLKYFGGILFGRMLAIVIYIVAMLIPALPLPENIVAWVGKPVRAIGGMFVTFRATTFDLEMIMRIITTIPTDINRLLQQLGEGIAYYGREFARFIALLFQHPKLAIRRMIEYCKSHKNMMFRIGRGTVMLIFSFMLIKAAMIFFLPLLGGIALTVVGVKVSMLIFLIVRMISDKFGQFLGRRLYRYSYRTYIFIRSHLPGWKERAHEIPKEGVRMQHRALSRHEKAKLAVQTQLCISEALFRQNEETRRLERIKEHAKRTSCRLVTRGADGKWKVDQKIADEWTKKVM